MTVAILNSGAGAWAFEPLAERLGAVLGVPVSPEPAEFNYVLAWDKSAAPSGRSFIPWPSIEIAADKRLQADLFNLASVPVPRTILLKTLADLRDFLRLERAHRWLLKYPTACGGTGHQFVDSESEIRQDWPAPYVVQEFIALKEPEVYRLYCVDGHLFGWNARRFPSGTEPSPWVAHARGARYVHLGEPPEGAKDAGRHALVATGLLNSFGAVDLLPRGRDWLVLEVGTDGLFNHVDRDFDNAALTEELENRLREAFWTWTKQAA